jgi:cysteine desulfurase/selenocysteine lyase
MLGPMATGVLWGRRDLLNRIPPYHVGSNMAHGVDFERSEFESGALKFQAGTPDVAGPVGLAAAVRFFEEAGHDALRRHDEDLVEHGLARLSDIPGLRIIGSRRPAQRVPVFTFVIEGHPAASVARALDARGIAIRAGDMAALPLLKRFGTIEAARASAYVYSTRRDLDRLADALRELSAGSIAASRLWHRFRGDPGARGSPLTRADLNAKGLPEDGHCRSQVSLDRRMAVGIGLPFLTVHTFAGFGPCLG